MADAAEPGVWRTVRVFISSTFRDMHAERDYLVKIAFPRLRQWCSSRRLHFIDVDLRWGVTRGEAEGGQAVAVCLREIDRSRPFFLCLLGGRYGWVPEDAVAGSRMSVTHLEVLHAALAPLPGPDGACPAACAQPFFYFRDEHAIPRPGQVAEEARLEHQKTFFEQDPSRLQALAGLKQQIRERFSRDGRVHDYGGIWDPDAENPEDERLRGRLTGLEALGERVEADLKRGIEAEFAGHLAALGRRDALAEEQALHDEFVAARVWVHVARTEVERRLTDFARGHEPRPLVLSGPPGSGKSATLAHWVQGQASSSGGGLLLARFIGASPASTNLPRLLGNLCEELTRRLDLTEEVQAGPDQIVPERRFRPMEVPADPAEIVQKWPRFLEAAAAKGRVVLVLDALNQLDSSADPKRLQWLSRPLPAGVRLIVSALDHGAASKPDFRAGPGERGDWLSALRRAGLAELAMPALEEEDRRRMARELPSAFAKQLDDDDLGLLLENPATRNPLFLATALHELRVFGSFDKLRERLASLPRSESPGEDIERTLDELFGQVLRRLEQETERRTPGLVPALFRLLSSAREGLSDTELHGLLARALQALPASAREQTTEAVLRQVGPYLVRKGRLIDFYHRSFWKAVHGRYLAAAADRQAAHRDLAAFFAGQAFFLPRVGPESVARIPNARKAVELPWQYARLCAEGALPAEGPAPWKRFADLLLELGFLEAKVEAGLLPDLLEDYATAIAALPPKHPTAPLLRLLAQALRADTRFLMRRPTAVFQCLWNRCLWHDREQDRKRLALENLRKGQERRPAQQDGPVATWAEPLLRGWRDEKERAQPGFRWVRALLPPVESSFTRQRCVLVGHEDAAGCLAYSPDGRRLFTGGGGKRDPSVRVWDAANGKELAQLTGHADGVTCLAVAPAGDVLAGGARDGTVRLWHVHSGVELHCLRGHEASLTSLAFFPDGRRIASAAEDRTVRVWDVQSGREAGRFRGHEATVACVAVSADGRSVVSGDKQGGLHVWDVRTGQERTVAAEHRQRRVRPALSPDGRLAVVEVSATRVCVVQLPGGETSADLDLEPEMCDEAVLSPDGRWLVLGTMGGGVRLADLAGHPVVSVQVATVQGPPAVALSPEGLQIAAAGCFGGDPGVWDASDWSGLVGEAMLHSHTAAHPPPLPQQPRDFCAFAPDGRWFVTCGREAVTHPSAVSLWRAEDGTPFASFQGHACLIDEAIVSPDARLVASLSKDLTVRLWDVALGLQVHAFGADAVEVEDLLTPAQYLGGVTTTPGGKGPRCLAFAPDSNSLAAGFREGDVRVWDVRTGAELRRLGEAGPAVWGVAFAPDGRAVAAAFADGAVRVWAADGAERARFAVDRGATGVAFAPDGKRLAAGASSGAVHVWDLAGQRQIACFPGVLPEARPGDESWSSSPGSDSSSLAFSPDGERVVAVNRFGDTGVGYLATGRWVATAGVGDPLSFARGRPAWHVLARKSEVVVTDARTGEELAWLPWESANVVRLSPADERCVLVADVGDVELLRVEGDLPAGEAAAAESADPPLVTLVRQYDCVAGCWEDTPRAACPWCGGRFAPPDAVGAVLAETAACTRGVHCFDVPGGMGDHPELLTGCPHCGGRVRFNPFVADRQAGTGEGYVRWMREQEQVREGHRKKRRLGVKALKAILHENFASALEVLTRQEALCRELGDRRCLSEVLRLRGKVCERLGQPAEGLRLYRARVAVAEALNRPAALARALGDVARLLGEAGEAGEALELEGRREQVLAGAGPSDLRAECLHRQALLRQRLGDRAGALEKYRQEEELCRELGKLGRSAAPPAEDPVEVVLREQERLDALLGEAAPPWHNEEAFERWLKCRRAFALDGQAAVLFDLGRPDEALSCGRRAERLFTEAGHVEALLLSQQRLALELAMAGRGEEATAAAAQALEAASTAGLSAALPDIQKTLDLVVGVPPPHGSPVPPPAAPRRPVNLLARVRTLLDDARPQEALALLSGTSGSLDVDNARGVCLLRLGRGEEAVTLFRTLSLRNGLFLRDDVPLTVQVNYATALLLANNHDGCRWVLSRIAAMHPDDPAANRLRNAMRGGVEKLPWGERLLRWLMGRPCPVKFDGPPGELLAD